VLLKQPLQMNPIRRCYNHNQYTVLAAKYIAEKQASHTSHVTIKLTYRQDFDLAPARHKKQ